MTSKMGDKMQDSMLIMDSELEYVTGGLNSTFKNIIVHGCGIIGAGLGFVFGIFFFDLIGLKRTWSHKALKTWNADECVGFFATFAAAYAGGQLGRMCGEFLVKKLG